MTLTFNAKTNRFEFRCGNERDDTGEYGRHIASRAGFKTAWETADNGHKQVYFYTVESMKAAQLALYADTSHLKNELLSATFKPGRPVMTWVNGVYIWLNNGSALEKLPKVAEFAFTRTPYEHLPRGAGAQFDSPVWWTDDVDKAVKCGEYADEVAQQAMADFLARRHRALESSRAQDADIEIPAPQGLHPRTGLPFEYMAFQRAGIAYASTRKRVLFGDEMGLGKSIQGVGWLNLLNASDYTVKRVLVICPASLKRNWEIELSAWLVRPLSIGIADSAYRRVIPDTDIVIINYDILGKRVDSGKKKVDKKTGKVKVLYDSFLRESLRITWDLLIVDECQLVKGDTSEVIRSRMVFAIKAHRMAFMSGTPMVNRPRDLWNIAHHLAPSLFTSKREFLDRYCKSKNPYDEYAGAQNLQELQQRIRSYFMVRRLKRDVLKDLPPKLRQVVELPATGCEHVVREEKIAVDRGEAERAALRLRVEIAKASDNPEEYKRAVTLLKKSIEVEFTEISKLRHSTALAKMPIVIKHIETVLESVDKIIIGAHHRELVEGIASHFGFPFMHGDIKPTQRQEIVTLFQTDKSVRGIVGSIGTMGVGWTLTASSYVLLCELSWVPLDVMQFEDRAHRIGQKDSVTVQHLVLAGSIDARMAHRLVEKMDVADRTLDREEAQLILAEPATFESAKVATMGITPKQIAAQAARMSPREIQVVHQALKLIAGGRQGFSFRDVDAPMGNLLAGTRSLSPKLGALGKTFLINGYGQQLRELAGLELLFATKETKK